MSSDKAVKLLTNEELSFFTGQVALMLQSGIALYESVEVLAHNYKGTAYEAAFGTVFSETENGSALYAAMEKSGIFPKYAVKMTQVGENTGKLEQVMHSLSRHYAREEALSTSIRNAVRYPIVLLAIMAIVVLILHINVLPLFEGILANLGADSMRISAVALSIGKIVGLVALILVVLLIVLAAVIILFVKNGKKQRIIACLAKLFPSIGKLENAISAERFLSILSISLEAGYPPENAAEVCAELIDDKDSLAKINKILELQSENGSLSDAISASGLLEPLKARMVKVGFMTGRQDEVTANVAEMYGKETDAALEKLLSMVEPTLVAILAVIIGCILLTIMLPLAGVMSSFL